jgi:hypothetical protein
MSAIRTVVSAIGATILAYPKKRRGLQQGQRHRKRHACHRHGEPQLIME